MPEMRRVAKFDKGTADIQPFDAKLVSDWLDSGDLVLLLGIAADGQMVVYESSRNPFKDVGGEPVEAGEAPMAQLALSTTRCGCKDGKRCVRSGNICCKGVVSCSPNSPPCT